MLKRFCDRCGKEIQTEKGEDYKVVWFDVDVDRKSATYRLTSKEAVEMCDDCYKKVYKEATGWEILT